MDIQLSKTQMDLFWNVLLGSPIGKSSSITLVSDGTVKVETIGDLIVLDDCLKAAKILGFSKRMIDQIQVKIDKAIDELRSSKAA